jgi:hypothetical protein
MEPQSPAPYPQVPATCSYPEPSPFSPHDPLQIPEDPSQYYPPIYVLVSPVVSFSQASPPTPLTALHRTFNSSHNASKGALYDQESIYRDHKINTLTKVRTETPVPVRCEISYRNLFLLSS